MSTKRNNPETIAIHGGDYKSDPATNAVAVPIYRTTSYQFNNTEHAANLFALKEFGNIYTRIMNPTNDVLEKRVAALEGGLSCVTVSSGQTASSFAILNVAQAGDNIVSSTDLYGGTVSLFTHTLSKLGIEIRYADPSDPKNFEKIAYVTQTTLSVDDTKEIISILKKKFSNIREPAKEDICYATTNRQMAVKNIAKKCDIFFVIGSRNSSNSVRLVEVAKKSGCENSILIHSQSEIPFNLIENSNVIGISSGASAPEILVENFIKELKNKFTVTIEEVEIIKENVVFRVPKKLN